MAECLSSLESCSSEHEWDTTVHAPLELVRLVRPLSGAPRILFDFDPRPDYARLTPVLTEGHDAIEIGVDGAGPRGLCLFSNLPLSIITGRHEITLRRPLYFLLSCGTNRRSPRPSPTPSPRGATGRRPARSPRSPRAKCFVLSSV